MEHLPLLATTGYVKADEILRGLIGLLQLVFPGQIRACLVHGSYSDGSAVSTSDLDLCIVFKDSLGERGEERIDQVLDYCDQISAIDLDVHAIRECDLLRKDSAWLRNSTLLVFGDDVRELIPAQSLEAITRKLMHMPVNCFARVRAAAGFLEYPMDYPDPAGQFFGYDCRPMRLPDGSIRLGIKELVVSTGWTATALVAYKAGKHVGRKPDCVRLYREFIDDEWTTLLQEIFDRCRTWSYLVPESEIDRERLRSLCGSVLNFENHFLTEYRLYLLQELAGDDEANLLLALDRLRKIRYRDRQIKRALEQARHEGTPTVRQAASEVLRRYAGEVAAHGGE